MNFELIASLIFGPILISIVILLIWQALKVCPAVKDDHALFVCVAMLDIVGLLLCGGLTAIIIRYWISLLA